MTEMTPMMRQYLEIKKEYADTILFYRLGDFYEMFFDDAKIAAKELELTLTGRSCGLEERAPMCGVPFHSADGYIARLVQKGYKVAICEQTEDPALAKGLVTREVTRIVTKGSVIETSMLDDARNNYLCCIYLTASDAGVWSEILLNRACADNKAIASFLSTRMEASCELGEDTDFDLQRCMDTCLRQFGSEKLQASELPASPAAVAAVGAALRYLQTVQKKDLGSIQEIRFYSDDQAMQLDFSSRRNLELVETMRNREKKGSLLWVIDKTKTAMGKRLLRAWIEKPLVQLAPILKRHNAVEELLQASIARGELVEALSGVYDMERLVSRAVYETANAKDLNALKLTFTRLPMIKAQLSTLQSGLLRRLYEQVDLLDDLLELIDNAISEEAPFSLREGGLIRDGFNEELDSLRDIERNCKSYITAIETAEKEKTGIPKLRIGYNRVFGYYIEVTNSYKELVPDNYIRKQTLANCERYITQELKDLESKVLGAQERSVKLEYEIFCQIRKAVAQQYHRLQMTATALATLDVLCSFATVAAENDYVCPTMHDNRVIDIREGRHPVVEKAPRCRKDAARQPICSERHLSRL